MYDHLVERFGPQQWWPARTVFEVVIGAYLTQNTTWKSVERSIANLEARGVLTVGGLREISEAELRDLIRPSGFMLRKAAALKAFVAFLDAHYAGQIEALHRAAVLDGSAVRKDLLALPGIGPETADAILLYALDVPAMVVDEYLRRIAVRHALVPDDAKYVHALVVHIGKTHCGRVARCDGCPLAFDLKQAHLPIPPHKMKP
jgi:endonuclease-3 related protein